MSLETPQTWFSVCQRVRRQIGRAERWIRESEGELSPVHDRAQLGELLRRRAAGEQRIGIMLGIEGTHVLRGRMDAAWLARGGRYG